ncbi:MAG: hypothetical protein ACNA7W_06460 [Pseudomonadales bacterium]
MKEWFVVTGDGALRMAPSVMVGESSSGALTLNDPEAGTQWVEFVLVGNDPWLTIATPNKALRVAGSTCLRHPLWAGTTVRLPHNTLCISHDIRMPRHSGTVIDVVPRSMLERLLPQRRQAAVLALGVVVLAAVVALLVPMGEGDSARHASVDPIRIEAPPASAIPPASAPATAAPDPAVAEAAEGAADEDRPETPDVAPFESAAVTDQEQPLAVRPRLTPEPPRPEPLRPVEVPRVERRAIPPVAQPAAPAPEPIASPQDGSVQQDAAAAAELELIAAMSQAAVAELRRQRDLLAADLALAQGRLTSPPEENAYSLYSRVLAEHPESPEARDGLHAVRQELINRALAQLAGNDLEGSRRTLQAAAFAGVDPQLVANLRDEVDYRQQLADAR